MYKWFLASLLAVVGCKSTLETGYEPRTLGASNAQRRAYYASPFSVEAQEALQQDAKFNQEQRPRKY